MSVQTLIDGLRLLAKPSADFNRPYPHNHLAEAADELERRVAYAVQLKEALEEIVDTHDTYCSNHTGVSAHSYDIARIAERALASKENQLVNTEGPSTQAGSGGQSPALPPNSERLPARTEPQFPNFVVNCSYCGKPIKGGDSE